MTQMTIRASGTLASQPDISAVIEAIAVHESKIAARSHMSVSDLQQEIRLACVKALSKFDPTRIGPSPYAFLKRCAKNHVFNLNRGTFVPNNPPCTRCHLWDKENKTCTIDELGCDKIVDYRKNMRAKAAIKYPDHLGHYDTVDKNNSDIDAFILDSSIRDILPSNLVPDYNLMTSGRSQDVSSRNKVKIRKIIKDLIQDG